MRFLYLLLCPLLFSGCKREPLSIAADYPEEVGAIIRTKCSVPGCHDPASKHLANGLDLSDWHRMFKGSYNNAVVIPYEPEHSSLYLLIDPDHVDHSRMMPKDGAHLTEKEIEAIRTWIASGAPDHSGALRFTDSPDRSKVFIANQGCDLVTVFDARSQLVMNTIDVGRTNAVEAPHDMFVSPDGQYLYLSFFANSMIQRYETVTGKPAGEIELSDWGWHSMSVSGNSKFALVSHLNGDGKVALLDLEKMKLIVKYQGGGYFIFPHGSAMNYNGTLAYITSQQGNFIYKMDLSDPLNPEQSMIFLDAGSLPSPIGALKPYEVEFSSDYAQYFVTCQGTNEVRVFKTENDSLIRILQTPGVPQLMAFSSEKDLMFVSCMQDSSDVSSSSSVAVFDLGTGSLLKNIQTGFQPRGLIVDDENGFVYVANRNISPTGWTPHHTTSCAGKNGYVTLIDLNTLALRPAWFAEVSVDPYSVAIKR